MGRGFLVVGGLTRGLKTALSRQVGTSFAFGALPDESGLRPPAAGFPTSRDFAALNNGRTPCAPTVEQAGSATRKAGVRWGC